MPSRRDGAHAARGEVAAGEGGHRRGGEVRTICERITTLNGKYKTYLAIELSGEDLVESINERLSKEEELKVDYDYQKFKESFDREMSKMCSCGACDDDGEVKCQPC